jgi:transposase InsO family protein
MKRYRDQNGLIEYRSQIDSDKYRLVVPEDLRMTLFTIVHTKFGHRGYDGVMGALANNFWWPRMNDFVRRALRGCLDCRRRKDARPLNAGLTQSVMVTEPGELLLIDFTGTVPLSMENFCVILVVVDCFTRYPFAIPMRDKTAESIALVLMNEVFVHIGLPKAVHSDNEPCLIKASLEIVFSKLGVQRSTSSLRHPQGNSPAERFIRYIHASLSIVLPNYRAWPQTLPLILFAYRVLPQKTTGYSPFFLMYGRHPLLPLDATLESNHMIDFPEDEDAKDYADKTVECLLKTFREVRKRQDVASRKNAERRDDTRSPVIFQKGDPILLFEPSSTTRWVCEARPDLPEQEKGLYGKWGLPWSGPHVVQKALRINNYLIYHGGRRTLESVNVDSMRMFHPFTDIQGHSGAPLSLFPKRRSKTPRKIIENPEPATTETFVAKGQGEIDELSEGDLCVVLNRRDLYEPIVVMKLLHWEPDTKLIVGQFYGKYNLEWYIDRRIAKQTYKPAWYQPKDGRFYYQKSKLHKAHVPFTNVLNKENHLAIKDIIAFGFHLQPNDLLPRSVAKVAIDAWRNMKFAPDAQGVPTYEAKDHDLEYLN